MKLEIDGTTTDNPSREDIARAIPANAPSTDWGIMLARNPEYSIEADGRADGRYDVAYVQGRTIHDAAAPVDGDELCTLFTLFFDGDKSWQSRHRWVAYTPRAKSASGGGVKFAGMNTAIGGVPLGAVIAMVAIAGFFLLPQFLPPISLPKGVLPAAIDSPATWIVIGFFLVCVLVFVLAAVVKNFEVRKAARWTAVNARIVRSESGFELKRPPGGGMPTNKRVPKVEYEFKVGNKIHRGSRVTLAEIIGEEEVPDILKRYPVGKDVRIYFDSNNPSSSVIERNPPAGIASGCAILFAFGLLGLTAILVVIGYGEQAIHSVLPDALAPVMALTAFGSLVFFASFVAMRRKLAVASKWPKTMGKVVLSETSEFKTYEKSGKSGTMRERISYMPIIEYTYKILGTEYKSRSVRLDTEVGGSKGFAQGIAAKYPVGAIVTIYYDPADPSHAALEFRGGMSWLMLAVSLLLAAAAVFTSGYFGRIAN